MFDSSTKTNPSLSFELWVDHIPASQACCCPYHSSMPSLGNSVGSPAAGLGVLEFLKVFIEVSPANGIRTGESGMFVGWA